MISGITTWTLQAKQVVGVLVTGLGVALLGCAPKDASTALLPGEVLPTSVLRVETALHRDLVENSVAVTSVSQPGIVFGLNDSGNEPRIFAFDSSGRHRAVFTVLGARNRDWEAAALGPCGREAQSCLYIGDVGDNEASRKFVTIYRLAEPVVAGSTGTVIPVRVEDALDIVYPDRPHDVEAMYVGAGGSIFLITKRRLLNAQGRPRRALIFQVSRNAWDSSGVATARLIDSLPIVPGARQGGQVTDAGLSPDGKFLAVRTYRDVFLFRMDSTGVPMPDQTPLPCTIRALREKQGEGIGWWWDGRRLLLTSERSAAPLHIVACPLPDW